MGPNNVITGPNDQTTGPNDQTTGPNDHTTGPNDHTTGPNDHTTGPNDQTTCPNNQTTGLKTKVFIYPVMTEYTTRNYSIFKKYKTFSVLIYSYINTSGNWKNEKLCGKHDARRAECFHTISSFSNFHEC